VDQLRRLQKTGGERALARVTSLPLERLRRALARASEPMVDRVLPFGLSDDGPMLLRVTGRNMTNGGAPSVTVGGEKVGVVKASAQELLLAPQRHQMLGELAVEPEPGRRAVTSFDLTGFWREPAPGAADAEATP
jgi:hypothetical protein